MPEQARRLAEAAPAQGAAVGPLVGVHREHMPLEVMRVFEYLAALRARFGLEGVQHNQGVDRVGGGGGGDVFCGSVVLVLGFGGLRAGWGAFLLGLRVEVFHVPLAVRFRGEGQRAVGAEEGLGRDTRVTL